MFLACSNISSRSFRLSLNSSTGVNSRLTSTLSLSTSAIVSDMFSRKEFLDRPKLIRVLHFLFSFLAGQHSLEQSRTGRQRLSRSPDDARVRRRAGPVLQLRDFAAQGGPRRGAPEFRPLCHVDVRDCRRRVDDRGPRRLVRVPRRETVAHGGAGASTPYRVGIRGRERQDALILCVKQRTPQKEGMDTVFSGLSLPCRSVEGTQFAAFAFLCLVPTLIPLDSIWHRSGLLASTARKRTEVKPISTPFRFIATPVIGALVPHSATLSVYSRHPLHLRLHLARPRPFSASRQVRSSLLSSSNISLLPLSLHTAPSDADSRRCFSIVLSRVHRARLPLSCSTLR